MKNARLQRYRIGAPPRQRSRIGQPDQIAARGQGCPQFALLNMNAADEQLALPTQIGAPGRRHHLIERFLRILPLLFLHQGLRQQQDPGDHQIVCGMDLRLLLECATWIAHQFDHLRPVL